MPTSRNPAKPAAVITAAATTMPRTSWATSRPARIPLARVSTTAVPRPKHSANNGTANSDGLSIDGPAAAITITGTANLRAETFDQTIEVRPKAGNVLTVVGAIAGGPVGAALGAAANAVLQRPIGEAAARTYRVTGPWKDPEVDVIRRGDEAPVAAPSTTPTPAGP